MDAAGSPIEAGDPVGELRRQAEEDLVRNVPPHSVEAEQAVLGGILLDSAALDDVMDIVRAEDFYLPAHRLIYSSCVTLADQSAPVDLLTVRTHLKDHGLLEEAGGAVYLATLAETSVSTARVDYHAGIVRDKAQMRSLISACSQIISRSFEPGVQAKDLLEESEQNIFSVRDRSSTSTYASSAELSRRVFEDLNAKAKDKSTLTGLNTGYRNLNKMTGGLQRSDLIIVAARPSMGKTAFALNLAMNAAEGNEMHPGVPVAVFSLEMSMEQLMQRMLCARGRVNLGKLRGNALSDDDWDGLITAADVMSRSEVYIDDTPALSIGELRARARRLARDKKIQMIMVDYLQLMRASRRVDSRELEISEISRGLKALAKELNIPVIALSQLNRKLEERKDKRPILSDLRESGAIEQDADLIMFIYRDSVYQTLEEKPQSEITEIIIGKHRNGQVGTAHLMYVGPYTRFEEPAPGVMAPYSG